MITDIIQTVYSVYELHHEVEFNNINNYNNYEMKCEMTRILTTRYADLVSVVLTLRSTGNEIVLTDTT